MAPSGKANFQMNGRCFEQAFVALLNGLSALQVDAGPKQKMMLQCHRMNAAYREVREHLVGLTTVLNHANLDLPVVPQLEPLQDPVEVLGQVHRGKLSFVASPHDFHIQLQRDLTDLTDILALVNLEEYATLVETSEPLGVFQMCVARPSANSSYRRGYILDSDEENEELTVFSLDVGDIFATSPNDVLGLDTESHDTLTSPPLSYKCCLADVMGPQDGLPWHPDFAAVLQQLLSTDTAPEFELLQVHRGAHGIPVYHVNPINIDMKPLYEMAKQHYHMEPDTKSQPIIEESTMPDDEETADADQWAQNTMPNEATGEEFITICDHVPEERQSSFEPASISSEASSMASNSNFKRRKMERKISNLNPKTAQFNPTPIPSGPFPNASNQPDNHRAATSSVVTCIQSITMDDVLSFFTTETVCLEGIRFPHPILAILYITLLKLGTVASSAVNQAAWLLMANGLDQALNRYTSEKQALSIPVGFLAAAIRPATTLVLRLRYDQFMPFYRKWNELPRTITEFDHKSYPRVDLNEEMFHINVTLAEFLQRPDVLQTCESGLLNMLPLRQRFPGRIYVLMDTAMTARIRFHPPVECNQVPRLEASSRWRNRSAVDILRYLPDSQSIDILVCIFGVDDVTNAADESELHRRYADLFNAVESNFSARLFITEPPPRLDQRAKVVAKARAILHEELHGRRNASIIPLAQLNEPNKMLNSHNGVTLAAHGVLRLMRILLQNVPQLQLEFK